MADIFGSSMTSRRQKYYAPQIWPTMVQTHDLQIIDSTLHVPEMLVLTTEPSVILTLIFLQGNRDLCGLILVNKHAITTMLRIINA